MAATSMKTHWEQVYRSRPPEQLGWYEAIPEKSLALIERCVLSADDCILDVGGGASTLVDCLLDRGFRNIVVADLSEEALACAQRRLGETRARGVRWIVDDVTAPQALTEFSDVRLWHDRAVLHFLTEPHQRKAYKDLLARLVAVQGYVIIAAFSLNGAPKCSGLPVFRYSAEMLEEYLGEPFRLLEAFEHVYHQPSGAPRPFVYTLFQRHS